MFHVYGKMICISMSMFCNPYRLGEENNDKPAQEEELAQYKIPQEMGNLTGTHM